MCHTIYLGRSKILLLVKLATITRHLDRGISVILSGSSSTGKSAAINAVLLTCDPKATENFTRTSAQYLLYRSEPLDHTIVTYFELQGTSHTAEIIRSALSEGVLHLGTVMKDASGTLTAQRIQKDTRGLVILSTHTGYRIDYELSTRVLHQEVSHDEVLTREVYRKKAQSGEPDMSLFRVWQIADSLLESKPIHIPYLPSLAELFPTREERYHRDYEKLIGLIKASALWHQHQREVNHDGAIVATEEDYRLIYSLANTFSQSVLPVSDPVLKLLELCHVDDGLERNSLLELMGVSERTLRRYIRQGERENLIEITGTKGNQTIKTLAVPERKTVLPEPEQIFSFSDDRLSEPFQTIDSRESIAANAVCPHAAVCPDNSTEAAKRTEPDNGGCPLPSVDALCDMAKRTRGHSEEYADSDSLSDEEFFQRGIAFYTGRGCTRAEAEKRTHQWKEVRKR